RYIYSTLPTDAYPSGYGWISGTSQAAPFVSGAAALVLSYNNTLTTAQLRSRILDNGDATASLSGKTVTGDRLNVDAGLGVSIDMPALISKGPTGSGKTEIHVINGSDDYESFIANLVTGLGYVDPVNAFLQLTDWNNNGNLDLVMIYSKGPTGSGKTEIHVVNGSNSYQSFLANLPTGLGYVDPANAFLQLLDWDGNGSLDLIMIFSKGPTGSGKTEIHVLNGSTSYKTFIANLATGLGYVDPANAFLQIVDWDGNGSLDLAMIFSKGPTGSGKTEIHVLSGSSSYKTFLANLATGLDYFDPADGFMELTDWDNNGSLDIAMIDSKGPTNSGKTEITVIDGSSSYQSTLTTLSTGMGYVDPTNGFIELTDWQ
ncbi:MAG: S8 family serine peptidase, partial [Candidatus Gracilibacteria bacterium]|nr:S8 family serine peptidase [Candidatus Gracilibacteria bacterium]